MSSSSKLLLLFASKDRDFLLSPAGTRVKISELEGKTIGIYFTANWYPPCRKFTPILASAYNHLKNRDPAFEVVFVSCDEDADAFDEYRALMPWLAIPFSDLETKRSLNRRFDIEDVPCFVMDFDSTILRGVDLIYHHGVRAYPFTKERVDELVGMEKEEHENQTLDGLLSTNSDKDFVLSHSTSKQASVSSLIGKTIGLYFSAQWCCPGVKFTPKLASVYQKINHGLTVGTNRGFEIVFLSSDHDQTSFDSYFETMPWMAIPYEENAYPFTEVRIEMLQRQVDEESKNLPETELHSGHYHELLLVSEGHGGGPFICCDCEEQGFGWAYQCMECGYEVHPKCVRSV